MKRIILLMMLAISGQAAADGYHRHHPHGHHHYVPPVYPSVYYTPTYLPPLYAPPVVIHQSYPDVSDVMLPMILGGVIGYALSDAKSDSRPSAATSPGVTKGEPVYQYQTIHDAECDCDKRVLVRVD